MENLLLTPIYKDPVTIVTLVMVLIMGVLLILQLRKRKTAQQQVVGMLDSLRVGMRVKTVGGVIGRIKEIREEAPGFKTVLLESGNPKNPSLVLYDIQAVYGIVAEDVIAANAIAEKPATEIAKPEDEPAPSADSFDAKPAPAKRNTGVNRKSK